MEEEVDYTSLLSSSPLVIKDLRQSSGEKAQPSAGEQTLLQPRQRRRAGRGLTHSSHPAPEEQEASVPLIMHPV